MGVGRRGFLMGAGAAAVLAAGGLRAQVQDDSDEVTTADRERMRALAAFTAETLATEHPMAFGADILNTTTGERLTRTVNRVGELHDPSAHAEVLCIRLGCAKLGTGSLRGFTLYTTCEPCAMCMGCALWAGLDRLVYGATITDASRFVHQISIPAKEVARSTDMHCVVTGPVERDACVALFTDARMQRAFEAWKKRS